MDSMDIKCGYLVVPVGVLSWAETVYYRCCLFLFWRLVAVFLWWAAPMGPVSLTLKPLCCTGGMSPGLYCACLAHLGFFCRRRKNVGVSAMCDMHSCSGLSNEWYLHVGGWCLLQVIVGV